MKILFVAMPFSIHTARWISQLNNKGFDIHLFSSMSGHDLHETIKGITFHENFYNTAGKTAAFNNYASRQFESLSFIKHPVLKTLIRRSVKISGCEKSNVQALQSVIQKVQPDIIHSLEMQHGGYLVSQAKIKYSGNFPVWLHSNWGIDLHFFGRLEKHQLPIRQALSQIDVFITEGERDEKLARKFGYTGPIYTFPSVGGGFIFDQLPPTKTSSRKKILLKGTQDIVRRGLVGLRALERCIDILDEYEIIMYSSNEVTQAAAELFYHRTKKRIHILEEVSHPEMMKLNKESRLNICINMSDGLPNSMLEAMMSGAFPIQSETSLASEWITHAHTGMIVPPEDPDVIEQAIRTALVNDTLVDNAAVMNHKLLSDKLEYKNIQQRAIGMYNQCQKSSN